MVKKLLYTFIYFLSPIPIILTLYNADPVKYGIPEVLIPMIFGAVAFSWLSWQFVVSARPKFLEKEFGMAKLYGFHGIMAVIAIAAVLIHKLLEKEGTFATDIGGLAVAIFAGISAVTLILMVDSKLIKLKIVRTLRDILKPVKVLHRQNYLILHNFTILGLILMFIHVMLSSAAQQFLSVRLIYITYFTVGLVFYIVHRIFFAKPRARQRFQVIDVIEESPVMWTIKLKNEKGHEVKYLPGQFGFFRFFGENVSSEKHPFSISSGGVVKEQMAVTIKNLGDFTSKVSNIKRGDKAIFDGPFGKFSYLNFPREKETVLVAGGVGITPMLSMLRYMAEFDQDRKVLLVWGARTESDLICKEEIEEIKKKMKFLSVVPVVGEKNEWKGIIGRVSPDLIQKYMKENKFEAKHSGIYICGPPPMMDSIVQGLKNSNSDKFILHFEKFSL